MLLAYIEQFYFECYRFKCFNESMRHAIENKKPFEWKITLPKFINEIFERDIGIRKKNYINYNFYNESAVQERKPVSIIPLDFR